MKRVTVGVKMDEEFVALLNANVQLSDLRNKDELSPMQQLALLVLMEARGATEEDVHAGILHAWRPHIEAVSDIRKFEADDQPEKVQR